MSVELLWHIEWMECKPQQDNYTNVVVTVAWRCNGKEGDYTATRYGTCGFSGIGETFTPYEELTKQQVLDWCWNGNLNKQDIEEAITQDIENQKNPPTTIPPLPWSAP